jgi:hypothetical protein
MRTPHQFFGTLSFFICLLALNNSTWAQQTNAIQPQQFKITLKNNSWLPHKVIIKVKDKPDDITYGTYIQVFLPFGTKDITVREGALVERMDERNVPVLMSGKGNQITGKLLVLTTPADKDRTFEIW